MRFNEDCLSGLEFPDYEETPSPTWNVNLPHQYLFNMTDEEIEAHVDLVLKNAPDDIYHIGTAPTNRFVGLEGIRGEEKDKENEYVTTTTTEVITIPGGSTANLLFMDDMEGADIFATAHSMENCNDDSTPVSHVAIDGTSGPQPWTLQQDTSTGHNSSNSARFEIRKNQPLVGSGQKIRSEVTLIRGDDPDFPTTGEVWYSFSIYFPDDGMALDDTREAINQWYEDGSDETTIRVERDKVFLEVCPPVGVSDLMMYDLFSTASSDTDVTGFTNIPKNQWVQFIFHFKHSTGPDGLIEVWRDGTLIHTINGRNMHATSTVFPKWKIGLYKASFLDGSSIHDYRILHFDNVKVGNSNAVLADFLGTTTQTVTNTVTTHNPVRVGGYREYCKQVLKNTRNSLRMYL